MKVTEKEAIEYLNGRYLMGGSRYVPDNFGSGWSKTGDRSK